LTPLLRHHQPLRQATAILLHKAPAE